MCTVRNFDAQGTGRCDDPKTYFPPEVSGNVKIVADTLDFGKDEKIVAVQVPGLVPLGQGPVYRLTGARGSHPVNHYGTAATLNRLRSMATDYFEATGIAIGINDMSLLWGGLFDIGPPDGAFWSAPHRLHRLGKSVDVDHLGVQEKLLNKIAERYRGQRFEVDRIHYEFP